MASSLHTRRALALVTAATLLSACTATTAPTDTPGDPTDATETSGPSESTGVVPPQVRSDAIAVLFSYPWDSIAEECETTLGPAGYGYVQTSPPQEHIVGEAWWTYYQPVSYELNSRMGDEAQFHSMVERCNAAGVEVLADAVVNHMSGQPAGGVGFAGSTFEWMNYPGLYDESDFHNYTGDGGPEEPCDTDVARYFDRWEVQTCRLVSLADLNTGKPDVQQTIADYLASLADAGVAGFRLDAAKHIAADELAEIWSLVPGDEELYLVQEVIRGPSEPIVPEEYVEIGDVHEFSYAREIRTHFQGSKIGGLLANDGIGHGEAWRMLPSDAAGTFVDNHDTERNGETLNYKYGERYDLAQAFTLAWDYGMPSVHSGYEFSDFDSGPPQDAGGFVQGPADADGWTRKHADPTITAMVGFRGHVAGSEVTHPWADDGNNAIAFSRGELGFFAVNNGNEPVEIAVPTSLPDGTYLNLYEATPSEDGSLTGPTVVVSGGTLTSTIEAMSAVALRSDVPSP